MDIGKTGVRIEFLGNSGFLVECKDKRIVIDPCNISDIMGKDGKADVVLVTHGHPDSCSIKDIERIVDSEKGSVVVCTADCQSSVMKINGVQMEVVEVGDKLELAGGDVRIDVIAAYNKRKSYHPKSEGWVGYLVKVGNVIVYHAGDTDFIPEMQKLSGYGKHGNEFVALLPVKGKSVMDSDEAAEAASVISPDLVIPMSYRPGMEEEEENAKHFLNLCREKNIRAEMLGLMGK